jgi:hypothetical protein
MKKQITFVLAAILIVSILNNAAAQKIKLLKKTHLADYPSASSLEFYQDKIYVVGDDAPSVWVLNNEHQFLDSIELFPSKLKRLDKTTKPDLESSTIIKTESITYLVCFSSFSTNSRNKIVYISLDKGKQTKKILDYNYKNQELAELNIEGATAYKGRVLLSNRANTTHKDNNLILTSISSQGLNTNNDTIIRINLPKLKKVIGISSISYLQEKDILLFTASTEDTPNAYTDGTIGTSYIGIIKNFSKKIDNGSVKVEKLLPVTKYLKEEAAQKIEALTVEKLDGKNAIIHLAADNDNGESTLFKLRLRLK